MVVFCKNRSLSARDIKMFALFVVNIIKMKDRCSITGKLLEPFSAKMGHFLQEGWISMFYNVMVITIHK